MTFSIETPSRSSVRLYNNKCGMEMNDSIVNPKVSSDRGDDCSCLFQIIQLEQQQDQGNNGERSVAIQSIRTGKYVSCRRAVLLPTVGWTALTEYRSDLGQYEKFILEQDSTSGLYTFRSHNGLYMSINRTFYTVEFRGENDEFIKWSISPSESDSFGSYFLNKIEIEKEDLKKYIEHLTLVIQSAGDFAAVSKALQNDLKKSIETIKNLKKEDFHIPEAMDAEQSIRYIVGIFNRFKENKCTDVDKENIANATRRASELINKTDFTNCPQEVYDIMQKMKGSLDDGETSFRELLFVSLFLNKIRENPDIVGGIMMNSVESIHKDLSGMIYDTVEETVGEAVREAVQETVGEVLIDSIPLLGMLRGTMKLAEGTIKVSNGLLGATAGCVIGIGSTITFCFNEEAGRAGAHICRHMVGSSSYLTAEGLVQTIHGSSLVVNQVPGTQAVTLPINLVAGPTQKLMAKARK